MKTSDFDFELPEELIARVPVRPRDHSRLLVLDRENNVIRHHTFHQLPDFLKSNDLLVVNESKVFPARLLGHKESGGRVELLLEHQINNSTFSVIGRKIKVGDILLFPRSRMKSYILSKNDVLYEAKFSYSGQKLKNEIEKIGLTPLPPYIIKARGSEKSDESKERKNYQTIYAKNSGSIAAPTAGLHFTDELLNKIKSKGIEVEKLTLHVGLGTFLPVKTENILEHKMHREYFEIETKVWQKILAAKKAGRRIVAVGTTTTRILEHLSNQADELSSCRADQLITGSTDIFIYPGYKFKSIDALITNFHLPKSTLLMLVSAFASPELINKAYAEAIKNHYRFYSYGDAMLIQ